MPVVNYYTVGGQLLGEQTTGQTPRDYVTDALGSVVGTVTSTGQAENTYRYKPYGALLAKTGTAPDPAFTWVGSQGYRQTGKKYSDVYVRARHYDSTGGRWTTKDLVTDPRSPSPYAYAQMNPLTVTDPSGELSMRTCDRQVLNTCGQAGLSIKWTDVPAAQGVIMQHVIARATIVLCTQPAPGCPSTCSNIPKPKPANVPFEGYELWSVDKTGKVEGYGADLFATATEGPSCGTINYFGRAKFLPDYKPGPEWQKVYGSPFSPNLQWTGQGVPPGWSDDGAISHILDYEYNCCSTPYRQVAFFTEPGPPDKNAPPC
jgi:RHS repeat-associated protein